MLLHELSPLSSYNRKKRRVGRGMGSGLGKTCGRGHKGQKARSGGGVRPGFEGGQMPFQRRVPKRGFNNIFAKKYAVVNVEDLEKFKEGSEIDADFLIKTGLIKKKYDGLKVLGNGELTKSFVVKAVKFSKSAKEKIEGAKGKADIV